MDFKYNFYDYDIATINCVNVSQVEADFMMSEDEDDDSLKEPKKFYTLTNCVDSFDVKIDGSNGDCETPPSTDIPIPIIETSGNDVEPDDATNDDFISLSVEKSYVVETYAELDLPRGDKSPEYVPDPPAETNALMEVEVDIPLKCKDCDFTTFLDEDLKQHMKVHASPTLFSCKVCGHLFKHSYSVKRHMRIHNKEAAYKCDECNYTCQRSEYLKAHKKTHGEEKPVANGSSPAAQYNCRPCSFVTDSKLAFKSHLDSHTKDPIKADDCDYSATKLLLGLSDSEEKTFKCTECNFVASKSINLKTHMRKHTDAPFKCKLCEYTTTKKGNFVVHLRNHTGEKPYRCASCSFMCKQFIHLKRHIRNHNEEDLFGCSKCDYRTGEGKELETHIKTHGGPEQSFLDDLQYETPDESSDTHSNSSDVLFMDTVSRKKSAKTKLHKCSHCDYTTNQTGNLKRHQKTHFKETKDNDVEVSKPISVNNLFEKVFECSECPYKATRKHQMDVHMRVHNGKQLFECNLCDYKTINKYNLSRHQKTHAFGELNGQITRNEVTIESETLT